MPGALPQPVTTICCRGQLYVSPVVDPRECGGAPCLVSLWCGFVWSSDSPGALETATASAHLVHTVPPSMGQSSSQAAAHEASRALRYGAENQEADAMPADVHNIRFGTAGVMGVAVNHTRSHALPSGQVITVTPKHVDVFNTSTGVCVLWLSLLLIGGL